jgi:hypothetical protein
VESSAAGLAALALFVLWLGYWVPRKARHRQQLGEARVEDRFSGGLRVLAVAAGPVTEGPIEPRSTVPLLAPGHGGVRARVLERTGASREPRTPGSGAGREPATSTTGRTETRRGEHAMQDSRESRLAVIEERARRARRRLVLTLVLLVATVAGWVAVATALVVWWAALVPTALLAVVLVLGRLAARSARRADERWAAERRAAERKALQARSLAAGGPRAPRNRPRVTGVAVRGSETSTQMIPRVVQEAKKSDGERGGDRGGDRPAPVDVIPPAPGQPAVSTSGTRADAADDTPVVEVVDVEVVVAEAGETADATEPSTAEAPAGGDSWDPRPLPLPTYVTKPAAPRREPRPLTDAVPAVASTGWATRPWQRAEAMGGARALEVVQEATPAPAGVVAVIEPVDVVEVADATPADDAQPSTETLGLPLEQILARRRAAG